MRSFYYLLRESCKLAYLYTIAVVGSASDYFSEKYYVIVVFLNSYTVIFNS